MSISSLFVPLRHSNHACSGTSVDADGVALAAIQGLNEKLEEQAREKDTRILELEKSIGELKNLVNQFVGQQRGGSK